MRERVAVTGAGGFIGRALVTELCAKSQHDVVAAVRRPVSNLPVEPVLIGDLDGGAIRSPFLEGVNVVIHAAARVHEMRDRTSDPLSEFRRVNVQGTLSVARAAARAGVRRFIYISSIKVNGESTSENRAFTEADPSLPRDPYAISKLEAEAALRKLAAETGMETVIIRPPLVYGPGVKGNMLRLLRLVALGIPLPFANVQNRRSLVSIRNLVDLVLSCIVHPAAPTNVLLVSDGEDLSTGELVRRLAFAMGRKARLFPVPLAASRQLLGAMGYEDMWLRLFGSLQVSCARTMELLGWQPPESATEGLYELGRWYARCGRAQ